MNDLDLCLEVVQGHVNHCGIFPKLLELVTSNFVSGFDLAYHCHLTVGFCILVYC